MLIKGLRSDHNESISRLRRRRFCKVGKGKAWVFSSELSVFGGAVANIGNGGDLHTDTAGVAHTLNSDVARHIDCLGVGQVSNPSAVEANQRDDLSSMARNAWLEELRLFFLLALTDVAHRGDDRLRLWVEVLDQLGDGKLRRQQLAKHVVRRRVLSRQVILVPHQDIEAGHNWLSVVPLWVDEAVPKVVVARGRVQDSSLLFAVNVGREVGSRVLATDCCQWSSTVQTSCVHLWLAPPVSLRWLRCRSWFRCGFAHLLFLRFDLLLPLV